MTIRGRIHNGVVELSEGVGLPEGTEVIVQPVPLEIKSTDRRPLVERLGGVVGSAVDLQEDFAERHDHYIHGSGG